MIFLNKPVGMLSQKANREDTSLVEYLIEYLLDSGQVTREELKTFHPRYVTGSIEIRAGSLREERH